MKSFVLRFLKIAERPTPPPDADASFELFNPSKRLLMLNWIRWVIRQFWALVGVVFSLAFLGAVDLPQFLQRVASIADQVRQGMPLDENLEIQMGKLAIDTNVTLVELLSWVEVLAIGGFLIQLVVSGFLVNLRWQMHWYMVSDRILGIRKGLGKVNEQTMTIANVQNMKIRQGPLQRLFGISDLEVHTAGGTSSSADGTTSSEQLHVGKFEGLDDAEGLRQTIRTALARSRTAGLGDPDDIDHATVASDLAAASAPVTATSPLNGPLLSQEARGFKDEVVRARLAAETLLKNIATKV